MYGYGDNAGPSGYAGRTTWTCLGGAYLGANVTINPYYANSYNTAKRRAVWVHEFGHALGLDHGPSNALMNTCAPCVYENYGYYFLRPDDVAGMNSIY
jgi:predicted Zn-dependent protease